MERFFAQELKAGKEITVKIDVGYPTGGGVRPNEFRVVANVGGKPYERIFTQ